MAAVRTIALGLIVLGFVASRSEANPVRDQQWNWWLRQQVSQAGSGQAAPSAVLSLVDPAALAQMNQTPTASTNTISNYTVSTTSATNAAYAPTGTYTPQYSYDAYINTGNGPYAQADVLTTGGAQAWYQSPVVQQLYGHTPTADEQTAFSNTVLQRVEQTFSLSHVPVTVTNNPADSAAHSLSIVSNTSFPNNPDAIGITNVGADGFSFIDKFTYAKSVDELEWAVAHNVAHELMHAFGTDHHDTTGTYLDGAVASWSLLTDPNAIFGPDAVTDLLTKDFKSRGNTGFAGAELLDVTPQPVPEATTIAIWSLAGVGLVCWNRRRRQAA